jgi:homoserine kinase
MSGIKAFAPASIGNIGVGFDIMGLALEQPGDEVIARKSDQKGVRITKMTGHQGKLPYEPEKNTAGMAVIQLLEYLGEPDRGIDLEVHKKLPLGSGMGSSAASAVAAVWATSELLRTGMSKRELLPFACAGEAVASGSIHGDNVAPSLLGGIILVRDNATFDVQRLYVPKGLYVALVHPAIKILTQDARAILKDTVPLKSFVQQTANAAAFVIGLSNGDFDLIGRCLRDVVIEPQRAQLIPGFYDVQSAAMEQGALGCTISGAGPAVFALCSNSLTAEMAAAAMQKAFTKNGVDSNIYLSAVNQEGAVIR